MTIGRDSGYLEDRISSRYFRNHLQLCKTYDFEIYHITVCSFRPRLREIEKFLKTFSFI